MYSRCCGVSRVCEREIGHADDGVHRRADLVAHVGEELALGGRRRLGLLPRDVELAATSCSDCSADSAALRSARLRSVTSRAAA